MNICLYLFNILVLLSIACSYIYSTNHKIKPHAKHTQKASNTQQMPIASTITSTSSTPSIYSTCDEIPYYFFKIPEYQRTSMKCFFRHTFNHTKYAEKFLALNFSHVSAFLSYSTKTLYPRTYIKNIIRLFKQKLGAASFVNATAFSHFLQDISTIMPAHFNADKEKLDKTESIKLCVYNYLMNNYQTLKTNPDQGLQELADQLYDLFYAASDKEQDIPISEAQYSIIQFLEVALTKLIWSALDQEEVWHSVKAIAHQLEQLLTHNILPDIETLDSLIWSLINSFCQFLELSGTDLSLECYHTINGELTTQKNTLWSLEEQENFITPKAAYLRNFLMQAEIKSRAYQAGLIADFISA